MRVLPGTEHPCFGNPLEASQLQKGVNDSIFHNVSTLEDGLGIIRRNEFRGAHLVVVGLLRRFVPALATDGGGVRAADAEVTKGLPLFRLHESAVNDDLRIRPLEAMLDRLPVVAVLNPHGKFHAVHPLEQVKAVVKQDFGRLRERRAVHAGLCERVIEFCHTGLNDFHRVLEVGPFSRTDMRAGIRQIAFKITHFLFSFLYFFFAHSGQRTFSPLCIMVM